MTQHDGLLTNRMTNSYNSAHTDLRRYRTLTYFQMMTQHDGLLTIRMTNSYNSAHTDNMPPQQIRIYRLTYLLILIDPSIFVV